MTSNALQSLPDCPDEAARNIGVGDRVRTGENAHPQFNVIAIVGNRAWLRDLQHGSDHVVPIDQCRRVGDGHA